MSTPTRRLILGAECSAVEQIKVVAASMSPHPFYSLWNLSKCNIYVQLFCAIFLDSRVLPSHFVFECNVSPLGAQQDDLVGD